MGRLSERNKQTLHYATYAGKTEIVDEWGNQTGEYEVTYSAPVAAKWNVGFVESDAEVQMFGISAQSTLRIVAPKQGFPLDESSIIWYGVEPTEPHNYVVAGIRPSLNELVFYARKVDMTYAPKPEPPEEPPEIEP